MQHIISVYIQTADCTLGFLLYLGAHHLPYYCMSFNVQSAERTLQVSARQSNHKYTIWIAILLLRGILCHI